MSTKPEFNWNDSFYHNDLVEKTLVAYLLRNHQKFSAISKKIPIKLFTNDVCQCIFKLLLSLHKEKKEWDWQIIADLLSSMEDKPMALENPTTYISQLMADMAGTQGHVELYIDQMIDVDNRQKVFERMETLKSYLTDPTKNPNTISTLLKEFQRDLTKHREMELSAEISKENLVEYFLTHARKIAGAEFIGTGFPSIDQHLAWGFHIPDLSIISGRPSAGKSLFRGAIQANMYEAGTENMLISREQSLFSEISRQVSAIGEIPLMQIIRTERWLNDSQAYNKIMDVVKYMQEKWPIKMIEPFGMYALSDVKQSIIDVRLGGYNPKVVFIDLFAQLDDLNVVTNTAQVIQQKTIETANLGKELGVHFCILVQQRRGGTAQQQGGQIDYNELLKGGGGYEERAHLVLVIDRPGKNSETIEDNVMDVWITKQKDGVAYKKVSLDFDGKCLKVSDGDGGSSTEEQEEFEGNLGLGGRQNDSSTEAN